MLIRVSSYLLLLTSGVFASEPVTECRCVPWSLPKLPRQPLLVNLKLNETPKDDILGPASKLDLMLCVCPKAPPEGEPMALIDQALKPNSDKPNKPTGSHQDSDWNTNSNSLEETDRPIPRPVPKPRCVCVDVHKCPSLARIFQNSIAKENEPKLKEARCDTDNKDLFKVNCCERTSCRDPQFRPGVCKSILYCKHLADIVLNSVLTPDIQEYLRKHVCEGPEKDSTCCADLNASPGETIIDEIYPVPATKYKHETGPETGTGPETETGPEDETEDEPDPKGKVEYDKMNCTNPEVLQCTWDNNQKPSKCCGRNVESELKTQGGEDAAIAEFPWMAILEYSEFIKQDISCGGALISDKFVLTVAHCVDNVKPKGVLLGEYDTSNSINETDYSGTEGNCRKTTPISIVSIRPICLPSIDLNHEINVSEFLMAAGFGSVNFMEQRKNVLQKVSVPYVAMQNCKRRYEGLSEADHICAGGERNRDACRGDSGSPLMRTRPDGTMIVELVGLVSFGEHCEERSETSPGVYTNVYHYIHWIETHVKLFSDVQRHGRGITEARKHRVLRNNNK